jgi:hypothetical protein
MHAQKLQVSMLHCWFPHFIAAIVFENWYVQQILTKAGDITSSRKKVLFTQEVYMTYIFQLYTRLILVISLQQQLCRSSVSPKRTRTFQTWTA